MRLHMAARLQLVLAIADDAFIRRNTTRDLSERSLGNRDVHRPHFDGLIWLHDEDVAALRPALYRSRRKHGCILSRLQQKMHVYKLVWPKLIVFVVEDRLRSP